MGKMGGIRRQTTDDRGQRAEVRGQKIEWFDKLTTRTEGKGQWFVIRGSLLGTRLLSSGDGAKE